MARIVFTQDGTYDVSVDPTHSDTSTYYVGPLNGATVELGYRTQDSGIILYEHGPLEENTNLTISHGYLHQVVAVVTGLTQPIELTFNKGGVPSYHGVLGAILENVQTPIKEDAPATDQGYWRFTDSVTGLSRWEVDPIQTEAPSGRHARDGDTGWVSIEPELQEIPNKMEWKNVWSEGTYDKNDVVTDDGWLMIANKQTDDKPAPQTLGDPTTALPDVPGFITQQNASVVYSGHLYTFIQGGWIRGLRVWVPTLNSTTNYQVVLIKDPNGSPQSTVITNPVLNQNNWSVISLGNTIVQPGDQYLIFVDALDSGTSTTWQYSWTYEGTSATGAPATGQWNRNNSSTTLRIHKDDGDGTNHNLELQVVPNTVFTITQLDNPNRFVEYLVLGSYVDEGTYYSYPVTEVNIGPGGGPVTGAGTQIHSEQPVASLTDYSESSTYWSTSPTVPFATVQGYLAYDGVSQPGVGDNAYGVDISFQRASVSDDWDFMSFSGSTSGGGTGSSPREEVLRVTWKPEVPYPNYQIALADNVPTPVTYTDLTATSGDIDADLGLGTFTMLKDIDLLQISISMQAVRQTGTGTDTWGMFIESSTDGGNTWIPAPDSSRYLSFPGNVDNQINHLNYTVYARSLPAGAQFRLSQITSDVSDGLGLITSKPFVDAPVSSGAIVSINTRTGEV